MHQLAFQPSGRGDRAATARGCSGQSRFESGRVGPEAGNLRRIHYGTTASISHLPIWVAKDAGFFAKKGLNVEPVQIRGGALITMGIMSGQLQFSGAGAESVVAARVEGGDVLLLACPVDSDPVYLITRPEIRSAAELKGKATAV